MRYVGGVQVYTVNKQIQSVGENVMRHYIILTAVIAAVLLGPAAQAVTIVQCKDAEGNVTYQKNCPPGTEVVETRKIYTGPKDSGPDLETLKENKPVVFYSVETCDACDLVRNYLNTRGIPFSEKAIGDDAELQEELIAKTGELSVPVVTIGEEVVEGYNKPVLKDKLDAAGYPDQTAQPEDGETSAGS